METIKLKPLLPLRDIVVFPSMVVPLFVGRDKSIKALNTKGKTELSKIVAESLAKKAVEKKITKIYFDRGLYKYHGRVKTFAEILRKNGMEF